MNEATPSVPSVLAMLLCDVVITDASTGKKTLVGIFDQLNVPAFPAPGGGFWVYARMTDAEGRYRFRMDVLYLDEDKPIARALTEQFEAENRLGFVDLAMQVPPLSFSKQGRYEFQLYANDVYIARTTMSVRLREEE